MEPCKKLVPRPYEHACSISRISQRWLVILAKVICTTWGKGRTVGHMWSMKCIRLRETAAKASEISGLRVVDDRYNYSQQGALGTRRVWHIETFAENVEEKPLRARNDKLLLKNSETPTNVSDECLAYQVIVYGRLGNPFWNPWTCVSR